MMPIGNGDIAAGVYAIEGGDLYLLLAKNDAYTYEGDIYKTGRVRIALEPNPFQAGKALPPDAGPGHRLDPDRSRRRDVCDLGGRQPARCTTSRSTRRARSPSRPGRTCGNVSSGSA